MRLGTWPVGWDVTEQPFREALGGALAFEGFAQSVDIQGFSCVLRNDAAAAIASFRKGSTKSPQMQRCTLRLDQAAASVNVDLLQYHVPGSPWWLRASTARRALVRTSGRA